MERYCAGCKTSLSDLSLDVLAKGLCPTCGGQISSGIHSGQLGLDGAIGMTFAAGSNIGEPLQMPFGQKRLDCELGEDTVVRAMPKVENSEEADTTQTAPGETSSPPVDSPASATARLSSEGPVFGASTEGDVLASMQLPSFDFSVPSFDKGTVGTSVTPAASTPVGDLPAHLQLPTFPQFDLPPIPGEAPSAVPVAPEASATAAVVDRPMPRAAGDAPPPLRAAPPPRRRPPPSPSVEALRQQAELPTFALPTLASDPKKKEVTLLGSEAAAELAEAPARKRPMLAITIIVLLICAGAGAWFKRDDIVAAITAKDKRPVVIETARDKALVRFAAGQEAYNKNKLDEAVKHFNAALDLLPKLPKAHRGLAIALAKQNRAAEAVDHYRIYLDLEPTASDAASVRKIVEDYEKAKATAAEKEKEKEKEKDKGKRKHR